MAIAALLVCIVIGITDGDTLTARCDTPEGQITMRVRRTEIDAPESGQPWGTRSREHLADVCFGKPAALHPRGMHRDRRLARVECDGTDAGAEQVRAGLAWVFDRYNRDHSLYALQAEARDERRGLWADREPVPPWEWRVAARSRSPILPR